MACFVTAVHIVADEAEYEAFGAEPFWEECKQSKPKPGDDLNQVILLVSRFVFNAKKTTGPRYNRAYKHARTLQAFARKGVPAGGVAEKLAAEKGSDYAFTDDAAKHPRIAKPAPDDEVDQDGAAVGKRPSGEPDAPNEKPNETPDGKRSVNAGASRPTSKAEKPAVSPDGLSILEVEIGPERLSRILGLEVGQGASIRVTCRKGDGDWKRIVATGVQDLPG